MLDLTKDDVTEQDVRQGRIFHGKDGRKYIGTLADGIEIDKTEINADGELVIAYSDNTVKNLGRVIGPDGKAGADGINGIDGVGIQNIILDEAGNLSVLLTNNTTISVGKVKGTDGTNGLDGKDGIDGKTPFIKEGYWWIGSSNTGVKAEGTAGTNGKDGINGTDGKNGISAFELAQTGGYLGTEADFITSLANIVDTRNITLGLHTDGLIYLFVNNNPIGSGIALPMASVYEIIGNIDSNNNIVITGALADGSYSVKYKMDNNSTVDIGELILDSTVYYNITNNLSNCSNSNGIDKAIAGQSYYAVITANVGYELKAISVTMGGNSIDIENNIISITNVTSDIIITATAEATEVINVLPQAIGLDGSDYVGKHALGGDGWEYGYRISGSLGTEVAMEDVCCSGFMPVSNIYDKIFIKNVTLSSKESQNNICFYNAAKERIYGISGVANAFTSQVTAGEGGVYSFRPSNWTADTSVAYFRFSCGSITSATIVIVEHHTSMS